MATALLEYLDLTIIIHSWFSHYNSLDWNSILLNHWRALQSWLIHPLTDFQLILLNGLSGRSGISQSRNYYTQFMVFSLISFKPQKVWGSIINLFLYKVSASCQIHFTLWVWEHIGVFSWIIANIFEGNFRILTKLGIKMRPYTTYLCT